MQDKNFTDKEFTDRSWENMRALLDENMPAAPIATEPKRKKRFLFWWLTGAALLLCAVGYFAFFGQPVQTDATEQNFLSAKTEVKPSITSAASESPVDAKSAPVSRDDEAGTNSDMKVSETADLQSGKTLQTEKSTSRNSDKFTSKNNGKIAAANNDAAKIIDNGNTDSNTSKAVQDKKVINQNETDLPAAAAKNKTTLLPAEILFPLQSDSSFLTPVALLPAGEMLLLPIESNPIEPTVNLEPVKKNPLALYLNVGARTDFDKTPSAFFAGAEAVKNIGGGKIGLRGGAAYSLTKTPYLVSDAIFFNDNSDRISNASEDLNPNESAAFGADLTPSVFFQNQRWHQFELLAATDWNISPRFSLSLGMTANLLFKTRKADYGLLQERSGAYFLQSAETGSNGFLFAASDSPYTPKPISLNAVLGANYKITPRLQIFSRLQQGLTDVYPNQDGKQRGRNLSIGAMWRLK